jgi:hypothetical protein
VHGLLLSDQLDYLLVEVADTLILQTVLIQIMVVLVVEVTGKIPRTQLEKHLEFTEPEVVAVVATPVDYLAVLVSSSFTIPGHKYLKSHVAPLRSLGNEFVLINNQGLL